MSTLTSSDDGGLRRAVSTLYDVFERYPHRKSVGCPCCHDPVEARALETRALRDLTAAELYEYADSAMMTWGDEADFKHFLPRIFEISAESTWGDWVPLETVFEHLGRAGWRTWPAEEQRAVEGYLMTLWTLVLRGFPSRLDVDTALCAIAGCTDELHPFLDAWLVTPGEAPVRHLAALLEFNGARLAQLRKMGQHWRHERHAQQEEIRRWLATDEVLRRVEAAFFSATDPDVAAELSAAVATLEWLRRCDAALR